ncbi:DUF885 domain-containing protein [Undibacterium sp. TJN25]|uniref:DUF885 domain-containing protein n=1 Tax=Undibacterium sp. TJN25 TaxID=3413056 RepID=UPI003BF02648
MKQALTSRALALPLSLLGAALLLALSPLSHAGATPQLAPSMVATNAQAGKQLNALADYYYEQQARLEPFSATFNGDNRFDDRLSMTIAPKVRAKEIALYHDIARKLKAIPRQALNHTDAVSYDILTYEINTALKLEHFSDYLLPLNQMDSVPVTLANLAGGQSSQPLQTVAQYDIFLRRLTQLPAWIDQAMLNMHEGMRRGIVLPRALVTSAIPQFQKLVTATAEEHPYYQPIKDMPANFPEADKTRLTAAYRDAIHDKLIPSLRKLDQFLETDYLAASRQTSGLGALPNGAAWYKAYVQSQTTTTLEPEEIHAIGLREVARIQAEFAKLGPQLGYAGEPAGLPGWMAEQARYKPFTSEAEILDAYKALNARIKTKLPSLFNVIPKTPLDIRPEPEISRDTASDHYAPPAADGSRPGIFWAVITDPKQYANTEMTTLFLHEGQPGHHFHLALMQEMDIPKFRKFGGNNAFTEGWALYAETLGREMGLYEDPNAYEGHLTDELLRASRLVVDTGLHAKGWTREQTIQYLRATLGYSEADARNATERYMAWPGQALGYKIGSLKIMELRQRATAALGPKFKLSAFNDAILSDGTLPLALLEVKMDKWIEEQKKL